MYFISIYIYYKTNYIYKCIIREFFIFESNIIPIDLLDLKCWSVECTPIINDFN